MLALIAVVIFALVAFGVTSDDVNLLAVGLAVLSAHFVVPIAMPGWPRRA